MPDESASPGVADPGGTQRFKRVLSRGGLIIYGLVILTPAAPDPVYGIVQQVSQGHAALSYLVAMVAMLFTAGSYGKMSGAFPSAGSTYTYAQRALNEHVGFLAGWAMMLDYFLIPLLSVIYVALTAGRLLPQILYWVWAALSTVAITLINVRGIRVTARASTVMMIVMSACALLFIWLAARWVVESAGIGGLVSARGLYRPESFALRPLMLGAAIATLSYIGFDAVSTLAEDTLRPERDIAFATVIVCVLQTVFCLVTVYLAALSWPHYPRFPATDTAILATEPPIAATRLVPCLPFSLLTSS